ncbi:hypothetical protein CVT24_005510 [Panaeolus cyanescens]|uniref:Protein kinase domain-containing protein n=1 Tax=Panaeolus cyanescens TaxID=181874 RepID=A0A409YC01_9AGAR|nr:hypothetical protein CVT24_005510 [Panaeolus cyanescens]
MLLLVIIAVATTFVFIHADPRFSRLRRLFHLHIIWGLRSRLHFHPLPRKLTGWDRTPSACKDQEQYNWEMFERRSYWLYLGPFFQLKGYTIFEPINTSGNFDKMNLKSFELVPSPQENSTRSGARRSDYPYARKGYTDDRPLRFSFSSTRVWPARDGDGNDLVIRLISDNDISDELRIWRRLHAPGVKNHPRNRAIPVIEYLEFDGLTFIVMPRWDSPADNDYATAEEVLNMAECIFDTLDFLHEHRIVHRDLDFQNIGLNVVINSYDMQEGHHNPKEAMYAIIDFGFSLIYPYETQLEEAITTLRYGWEIGEVQPPRNPFTLETHYVVQMMQQNVRVIEKFIPEIGRFFDDILNAEEAERPFAREVLQRFRQFKSSLTVEQLNTPLQDRHWIKGIFIFRSLLYVSLARILDRELLQGNFIPNLEQSDVYHMPPASSSASDSFAGEEFYDGSAI